MTDGYTLDEAMELARVVVRFSRHDVPMPFGAVKVLLDRIDTLEYLVKSWEDANDVSTYTDFRGVTHTCNLGGLVDNDGDYWFRQPDGEYRCFFPDRWSNDDARWARWDDGRTYREVEFNHGITREFGPGVDMLAQLR